MELQRKDFIKEISFKTSRSGGSGGQNVNKVSTKVELIFNIKNSAFFSESEILILLEKLKSKLDLEGNLHIISQKARSQLANKEDAIEKALGLLKKSLHIQKKRKLTKIPRSIIEKRLTNKSVISTKKETRKKPGLD